MRRMLDPKEIGGGSTAPTRHCYMVLLDNLWYIAITSKDYGFEIGENTSVPSDFLKNDKYKELRSVGIHPSGGFYKYNTIPTYIRVQSNNVINTTAYDIKNSQAVLLNLPLNQVSAIVQLN